MSGNSPGVWLAIGWTMVHFVWVGGLIGVVAAVALRAFRQASAEVRYGVALASLTILAAAPAAIAWHVSIPRGADPPAPESGGQDSPRAASSFAPRVVEGAAITEQTRISEEAARLSTVAAIGPAAAAPRPASLAFPLDAVASRLPWLWLIGSPITFAWLALGLAGAERLRRHGAIVSEGDLPDLCRRLADELGIARDVAVAVCDRLAAPVLVGIARPLILLPMAALGGWAPDQLEMVLLHELAHVRRWDNLVNLLQRLVESALFFQPAVWVVSGWVRREREHCCDGVVVAHTGRARAYAETLLALADPGSGQSPRAAVAMVRNDLVSRVRRILNLDPEGHAMKLPRGLLALTAALVILPAGWTFSLARLAGSPAGARAQEKGAADGSRVIQGKTIDEWLAALKDRDPAVRKRPVEVLGARVLDPAGDPGEKLRLQGALGSLLFSDTDAEVRRAVATFAELSRVSHPSSGEKRAPEDKRAARRDQLMKLKGTYSDLLKHKRETLRKLAEAVGPDDRQTLALREQYAIEHQHYLETERRAVETERRKREAQRKEPVPGREGNDRGAAARDSDREMAMLSELEQRLKDEIKAIAARNKPLAAGPIDLQQLQDEIAQTQAVVDAIEGELKALDVGPAPAPPARNDGKAVTPRGQGKTIDEWKAALQDRDPAVRKRAVEILGERAVDPAVPADEKSRLQIDVRSLMLSDKDRDVSQAAAFYADLFKVVDSPEMVERLLEEHRRAVDPARRAIRLVDVQGRPVAGAVASTYFQRDADHEAAFTAPEPIEAATSNARGLFALKLEIPGHIDGAGIYAIRQDKDRPLVGLGRVTREEIDKPITIVMHPACRVSFRIDSKGLPALEAKYHAELTGPGWWRAAYVWLGETHQAPRPLFTSSTKGELEFLLPPGRVMISAYGSDVKSVERSIEIKPDDRELSLGTLDVAPSPDAEQGRFPDHHRVRRSGPAGGPEFVFRRIRSLPIRGMAREAHDLAFSPDGKLLASAHSYNADPGEVKLWDMTTGAKVATLPVADRGVSSVAFSLDGKTLAARVHAMADPRSLSEIVLWDVASRREARRLGSRVGQINALAFSPDGKMLVTSGADRATRFWDVASGREDRRIDGAGSGRALAFSPDGQTLVMTGGGGVITLWDVAGNRLRAALEPETERFAVYAIAYAPDGRTLAAAGSTFGANRTVEQGQARLYDLSREPPARRSVLTFDRGLDFGPNQQTMACSDVAFTPDGRRVAAVGEQKVRIWDVATGTELDAFERGAASSSDRLAISPDGRWMAVTSPFGYGIAIYDISPSGP